MAESKAVRLRGLSPIEVEHSRRMHGANVFSEGKRRGFWWHFLQNLGDPVIKVLLAALAVNLLLIFRSHDWFETVGIAVSVFLATFISTLSECGSEAAFARLCESCGTVLCRVLRGGRVIEIETSDVVVGDVVLLSAGEKIPADGVVFEGELALDQSALTGESREVAKKPLFGEQPFSPAAGNALFAGSTVLSGSGKMEVRAVGDATFLGGISGELQQDTRESPLKRRLSLLAHQISRVGYVAAVVCALAFLFHNLVLDAGFAPDEILARLQNPRLVSELLLHALMLGLTVVVVAVPEGLPMMIAVVLSANIKRMARDGVLVRKPVGVEAAGSMNILFTDKTGTLTEGKLTLGAFLTPLGDFSSFSLLLKKDSGLADALLQAAYAAGGAVRGERDGRPTALGGNATDRALLGALLSAPAPNVQVRERLSFDSSRKFAAASIAGGRSFVIGAPERLLPYVTAAWGGRSFARASVAARITAEMKKGARVLLLCEAREMPREGALAALTFLAAVTFDDPLRPASSLAVRTLQSAGVQVVMMTGDGKDTAVRIAKDCGILKGDGVALDGAELAALSDAELCRILPRLAVIARALPSDKSRLVRLSESMGLVVGMTGDGINDAPALKAADIGFAMGSGTQVAREAGDIVIVDDNLSSISRAVLYGRTIFKSIRKFITLQLVMNFCAVGISLIGPFIGFASPVTVVQMLWINMIMDTLGGLAFAGEAPLDVYMREPPKGRDEPILTRALAARIAYLSVFSVALSVFFLKFAPIRGYFRESAGDVCLLTAFFALFIFAGVFNCFNARTDRVNLLAGLSKNPTFILIMGAVAAVQILFVYLGGTVLRTVPLTAGELFFTLSLALTVLPVGVFGRICSKLRGKRTLY